MANTTDTTNAPGDISTVVAANEVLTGRSQKNGLARLLPFLGPAFIASVAYVDPGNFATNIATGTNLAEQCRVQYSWPVVWAMWVLMELVAVLIIALNGYLLYQTLMIGV